MQADSANEIDPAAPVTEQASGWWVLLNESSATEANHRAFAEWLTGSPERVGAYLRAARVAKALCSPRTEWPDTEVDELIRDARASSEEAHPSAAIGHVTPSRRRTRFAPRFALAAATVLAVVVVAIGFYSHPWPKHFETALGEQRSVTLDDGSLVTLNTKSAIDVRFDEAQRRITLLEGEALFQVAHDVNRPFNVSAGEITVRAVGTQFNVDRHSQATKVMVVEGRVEVSAGSARLPLGAGELLTLAPNGTPKISQANAAAATAWTRRQLVFENRPLGEVAAELNRYNRQVIDIRSPQLRDERVTGVFQSNDPRSFLAFISRIPGVSVETSADHSRYIVRLSGER